jgi:hypothetical protein
MQDNLPFLLQLFDEIWSVIGALQIAEEAKKLRLCGSGSNSLKRK